MSNLDIVQSFLGHVFSGRLEQALALVDDDARFVASRPTAATSHSLYGEYRGPAGAARMFVRFGDLLEAGRFDVDATVEAGEHVLMYGSLTHRSRASGRSFESDWALVCKLRHGRIVFYHFYEDTEALAQALAAG